jgi:hypothetical protein
MARTRNRKPPARPATIPTAVPISLPRTPSVPLLVSPDFDDAVCVLFGSVAIVWEVVSAEGWLPGGDEVITTVTSVADEFGADDCFAVVAGLVVWARVVCCCCCCVVAFVVGGAAWVVWAWV